MPYDTRRKIMLERVPKYTLRKLSVGLASVMIGSGILMNSPKVLAATTVSSQTNQNEGNSEIQSGTGTTASGDTHASSGTPASSGTTASGDTPASSSTPASSDSTASATTTNAEEK